MRILIVDDNPDIAETTAELLGMAGYETHTAILAKDILPQLEATRPDLLLQDVHMPGLDVGALIKQVRAHPNFGALPIVLFTASVQADDFWRPLGADGVLRKPFDATHVRRFLDHLVTTHAKVAPHAASPA